MRRILSLFKTLLMLIPMTAVPVMAIFGIPQFFPVSASPSASPDEASRSGRALECRVGQSDALQVRHISTNRASSIDLFQPYDAGSTVRTNDKADVVANAPSNELERRRLGWRDPLNGLENVQEVSLRTASADAAFGEMWSSGNGTVNRRVDVASRLNGTSSFSGQAAIPPPGTRTLPDDSSASDAGRHGSGSPTASPGVEATDPESQSPQVSGDSGRYARTASAGRLTSSRRPVQVETLSWQQAVDRLNILGIRTFRLTPAPGPNGYRFVCLVTSVDDPRISRRFESESADPLVAVGNVLAQVENWNLHQ